jgi:hypothetical protein
MINLQSLKTREKGGKMWGQRRYPSQRNPINQGNSLEMMRTSLMLMKREIIRMKKWIQGKIFPQLPKLPTVALPKKSS